jgi:hypothetical protein
MLFPPAIVKHSEIEAALGGVVRDLWPSIVRIKYSIELDWNGEWGIFFKVVLADRAIRNVRENLTFSLLQRLGERLNWEQLGVIPYFNYRSESEQAELREPAWA